MTEKVMKESGVRRIEIAVTQIGASCAALAQKTQGEAEIILEAILRDWPSGQKFLPIKEARARLAKTLKSFVRMLEEAGAVDSN